MKTFEVISFEESEQFMPQAWNVILHFRSLFFKHMPEDLQKNCWIAGGAIRNWLSGETEDNDVDFFAPDRESMAELVKWLRANRGFKHYLITKNAIKGYVMLGERKLDVDIVKKPFQNPTSTIEKFDFTVCCFAVNYTNFYFHQSAAFDLLRRRLVINELPHPVDTLKRLQKYTKKGFNACNGTLVTLARGIAELDENDTDIFAFYKFD